MASYDVASSICKAISAGALYVGSRARFLGASVSQGNLFRKPLSYAHALVVKVPTNLATEAATSPRHAAAAAAATAAAAAAAADSGTGTGVPLLPQPALSPRVPPSPTGRTPQSPNGQPPQSPTGRAPPSPPVPVRATIAPFTAFRPHAPNSTSAAALPTRRTIAAIPVPATRAALSPPPPPPHQLTRPMPSPRRPPTPPRPHRRPSTDLERDQLTGIGGGGSGGGGGGSGGGGGGGSRSSPYRDALLPPRGLSGGMGGAGSMGGGAGGGGGGNTMLVRPATCCPPRHPILELFLN